MLDIKKYNNKYNKYCKKIENIKLLSGGSLYLFDWFECAFGFKEKNYYDTQKIFKKLLIDGNMIHLNKIKIGEFKLLNNAELHEQLGTNTDIGKNKRGEDIYDFSKIRSVGSVNLQNIIEDIRNIHKNKLLIENATIQVASQLNCLEMMNQNVTPENGITGYINDNTQGPICAMCAPAGLAFRNYLYDGGQTKDKQINMAFNFLNFIKKYDKTINCNVINGYLMFNEDEDLRKINRFLSKSHELRKEARHLIQSGMHINQGVFIGCTSYEHTVNHVYCSGLPISYNKLTPQLWYGISEIFLEAMYENTLLAACLNNKISGKKMPCYLTHLGGGVFGMPHSQIKRAIQRACNIIAKNGLDLDVKIINYKTISHIYSTIPKKYPIYTDIKSDSIWDNGEWISKSI
jgi:hypothetical protein